MKTVLQNIVGVCSLMTLLLIQVEEGVSSRHARVTPKSHRSDIRGRNAAFSDHALRHHVIDLQLAQTHSGHRQFQFRCRAEADIVARLRHVAGDDYRRVADVGDAGRQQAAVHRLRPGTCHARQPQAELLLDHFGLGARQRLRDFRLSGQQVGAAGVHVDDSADGVAADPVAGKVRRRRGGDAGRHLGTPADVRVRRLALDARRVDGDGCRVAGVRHGHLLVLGQHAWRPGRRTATL